ncbi:hypothetical protein P154DRAFT_488382 [Amniculicola lignicola CBS 123094]|uniref:Uncharacterized protein n=1 Tax=Amniculicola lignicola CBS 123094 TaxID=1392246 RepID=A0A6A5WXN7_9PLEO|nr:hypothetical protein P154DRAFT_488382 [Amniculicola lignicola CBS 123094]
MEEARPRNPNTTIIEEHIGPKDEDTVVNVATVGPSASPIILPDPPSPGFFARHASISSPSQRFQIKWPKRHIHRWKSPMLMILFFIIGLAMSLAHCIFYPKLSGKVVGDSSSQEEKLRYVFGTAFSFLAQISLAATVWTCYTQWLWRTVKGTEMTVGAYNAAFGADTSFLSLMNIEMLRKMRLGSVMALFAWSLLLPPFFTPATLFVYPSTNIVESIELMPYPSIANATAGRLFAYSPPILPNRTQYEDDKSRTFTGPRTILSLIASATASLGEILPVSSLYNSSSYSVSFFAPIVRCFEASASEADQISEFLRQDMRATPETTQIQVESGFFGFVPTYSYENGNLTAISRPRQQTPHNATNELWMTFLRGEARIFQVCKLFNASYELTIERDHGFQNITGSYQIHEEVPAPDDKVGDVSDMAQHAYSAFMWVLADQLVGRMSWYTRRNSTATSQSNQAIQYGVIESPIQRTGLLGSSDLDAFFLFDEKYRLYKSKDNESAGNGLSPQRLQDKAMAGNRTLDVLIEELSFNITVSLMHNVLLTDNIKTNVKRIDDVNRYGYKSLGLFIPYGLAVLFTFVTVLIGIYSYIYDDVLPDKKFQDIVSAAEDPEIIHVVRSRQRSMTVMMVDGQVVLKAGPEMGREEVAEKVKVLLAKVGKRRGRTGESKKERGEGLV